MTPQQKSDEMMQTIGEDPETTQSVGRLAECVLSSMYNLDVSSYSVMEITVLIDTLKAARKAKLQKHLGLAA